MKIIPAVLAVVLSSIVCVGCASRAKHPDDGTTTPSRKFKEPAPPPIYHDYDYGWNGDVTPYRPHPHR